MKIQPTRKNFPPTYRAEEMQILAGWILTGEGGSVVGLAGCGRSNLLYFLCQRPEALRAYLPPEAGPTALIPVDLNQLPATDPATLYRLMLRAFYWARARFEPQIQEAITALYLENRAVQDPFLTQSALYEVFFTFQEAQTRVVLVLNHFGLFCQVATPQMLNTLRSLRDTFKASLCFIVGMLQEIAYLPDPEALGDMYTLLDNHICWVGPMNESDARWVIATVTQTAPIPPSEAETQAILSLSGHFPVLLKAIGDWWLHQADKPPPDQWPALLAAERSFDYRLARIWNGLTQEEQFALAAVREWQERVAQAQGKQSALVKEAAQRLNQNHALILLQLAAKGVCHQSEAGWQTMGTLLADYIRRVGPSGRGKIRLDEQTEEIRQGLTPLPHLSPQEDKLLRFMLRQPYKRHTKTDLIDEVWSEDEAGQIGITANHLQKLVSDLRQKIEVRRSEPRYFVTWIGAPEGGYQFYPEGRPE